MAVRWGVLALLGWIAWLGVARLRRIVRHRSWWRGPETVDLTTFRQQLGRRR